MRELAVKVSELGAQGEELAVEVRELLGQVWIGSW